MTFVDELAVVGTNVGEISAILDAPELKRPAAETKLNGLGIRAGSCVLCLTSRRTVKCSTM